MDMSNTEMEFLVSKTLGSHLFNWSLAPYHMFKKIVNVLKKDISIFDSIRLNASIAAAGPLSDRPNL